MKENFARIVFILDQSGSMMGLREEAVMGFNNFVTEQQAVPGHADLRLVLFNIERVVMPRVILENARILTQEDYKPDNGTALLDAIGQTIFDEGRELDDMQGEHKPGKVIFAIFTDGYENSSRTYTKERVAEMIAHQQERYKWEFFFLGANMDAIAEGMALNIPVANSMNFAATGQGLAAAYNETSSNVTRSRMAP